LMGLHLNQINDTKLGVDKYASQISDVNHYDQTMSSNTMLLFFLFPNPFKYETDMFILCRAPELSFIWRKLEELLNHPIIFNNLSDYVIIIHVK